MWPAILGLVLLISAASIWAKLSRSQRRLQQLRAIDRIRGWEDVSRDPKPFRKMVRVNLGFGEEVWIFSSDVEDQIDLKTRAFSNGFLVYAPPGRKALERFCRQSDIHFVQMQAKTQL